MNKLEYEKSSVRVGEINSEIESLIKDRDNLKSRIKEYENIDGQIQCLKYLINSLISGLQIKSITIETHDMGEHGMDAGKYEIQEINKWETSIMQDILEGRLSELNKQVRCL